jgi:hypothetical protein
LEAVTNRAQREERDGAIDRRKESASERFEASAHRIARVAETLTHQTPGLSSEGYDSTPFGLKRRVAALAARGIPGRRSIPDERDDVERIRRAFIEVAKRLLAEMVHIDAELGKALSPDYGERSRTGPKTMSGGSDGSC